MERGFAMILMMLNRLNPRILSSDIEPLQGGRTGSKPIIRAEGRCVIVIGWDKITRLRATMPTDGFGNASTLRDRTGFLLVFDPVENDFMLAERHKDTLLSIGVRGDAVGCFMSR